MAVSEGVGGKLHIELILRIVQRRPVAPFSLEGGGDPNDPLGSVSQISRSYAIAYICIVARRPIRLLRGHLLPQGEKDLSRRRKILALQFRT
jgi:hypothetical protein